jgi:hypothetical protein
VANEVITNFYREYLTWLAPKLGYDPEKYGGVEYRGD